MKKCFFGLSSLIIIKRQRYFKTHIIPIFPLFQIIVPYVIGTYGQIDVSSE